MIKKVDINRLDGGVMLITLSRRTDICQSVAEVYLTCVAPLGAVSHEFNFKWKQDCKLLSSENRKHFLLLVD